MGRFNHAQRCHQNKAVAIPSRYKGAIPFAKSVMVILRNGEIMISEVTLHLSFVTALMFHYNELTFVESGEVNDSRDWFFWTTT